MKTKIVIFFALVSCFRGLAEEYADCEQNKANALNFILRIETASADISTAANEIAFAANSDQYTIQGQSRNIQSSSSSISFHAGELSTFVSRIQCSSNDTCSVDLSPLAEVCSNIYDVIVSEYSVLTNCSIYLSSISEDIDVIRLVEGDIFNRLDSVTTLIPGGGYLNVLDSSLLSAVSNFNNDVSYSFNSLTNQILFLSSQLSVFQSQFSEYHNDFLYNISRIITGLQNSLTSLNSIYQFLTIDLVGYLEYLRYLQDISRDISYLATNEYFNVNVNNLSNFFSVSSANVAAQMPGSFHRLSFEGNVLQQASTNPYNSPSSLRRSNLAETVQGGFANLLTSTVSLNNYFYWLMNYLATNKTDLTEITTGLANLTNILNRVDDYVLGDFSNQFYHVFECIDTLVSNSLDKVDYTTNLVEITNQLYTNNNHLASIDSKLDVLDYIKILSDTPLADYSGDIDYFDYLTNLYLSGVSSSGASTNWFERMEILLASLVFGDSDGTNDIPQSVEMQGFDTDRVSDTMSDFAFSEDFSTSVDNLSQTSRNFMQVLNGYSSALHAVSAPATVSIGTGGIDGSDTSSFEDMMHGHFQVSFNTGTSDRFTVVVRAVTTMSWVLLTMIFIWHCGFWILQKIQFLYRLMRLLINSIWLKS